MIIYTRSTQLQENILSVGVRISNRYLCEQSLSPTWTELSFIFIEAAKQNSFVWKATNAHIIFVTVWFKMSRLYYTFHINYFLGNTCLCFFINLYFLTWTTQILCTCTDCLFVRISTVEATKTLPIKWMINLQGIMASYSQQKFVLQKNLRELA
jgi:hypothetical protein